jgi:hypothetical protein
MPSKDEAMTMMPTPRSRAASPLADRIFIGGSVALCLTFFACVIAALHMTGF